MAQTNCINAWKTEFLKIAKQYFLTAALNSERVTPEEVQVLSSHNHYNKTSETLYSYKYDNGRGNGHTTGGPEYTVQCPIATDTIIKQQ